MDRRTFLAGGAAAALPAHPDESKERYYSQIGLQQVGGFQFWGTAAQANNVLGEWLAQDGPNRMGLDGFALASRIVFEAGLR